MMQSSAPASPRRRPARLRARRRPALSIGQILAWADTHFARTGHWPGQNAGHVAGTLDEKWGNINVYLSNGSRGLPGGSTLARLLEEHRGVRNPKHLPPYTIEQILLWADAHFARTGRWPNHEAGPIADAPGESWSAVEAALCNGKRGQPGGSSLARVLNEHRGVRNPARVPPLSVDQILAWADAHLARTGRWPTATSGVVSESPADNWRAICSALVVGMRGLPRCSLGRLLKEQRGVRYARSLPPVSVDQILAWADAHFARTGRWPGESSGQVFEMPEKSWQSISEALRAGRRGLPRCTLGCLLNERRGVRNLKNLPPLSVEQILKWMDAHRARTGRWPTERSGPVSGSEGETWGGIAGALYRGTRELPRGSSLARLRAEYPRMVTDGQIVTEQPEEFGAIAALGTAYEQFPREGIGADEIPNHSAQAVEAAPHARRFEVEVHAHGQA